MESGMKLDLQIPINSVRHVSPFPFAPGFSLPGRYCTDTKRLGCRPDASICRRGKIERIRRHRRIVANGAFPEGKPGRQSRQGNSRKVRRDGKRIWKGKRGEERGQDG